MSRIAAVVLAAGKGTRMKTERAKVLHAIAWRPMLAHVLDAVAPVAARRIVVVGHEADAVRKICDGTPGVEFAEQREQRGTGHAVQSAAELLKGFDGTVLVLAGDVPLVRSETLASLIAFHTASKAPVSVLTTTPSDPGGYGRIVRDPARADRILRIVEHRDATAEEKKIGEINSGLIAADAKFLFDALSEVKPDNSQHEIYLTDVIGIAAKRGTPAAVFLHVQATELEGINDRAQLARQEAALFLRSAQNLQASGVTILDPSSTRIDPRARIGVDAIIHPNVEVRGASVIGTETVLETGSIVDESVLGDRVHVKPYCVITRARAGDRCVIGPFAHLRPEADLAAEVHVGNFVEVKKSTLGKGSKANHLSYLGDATIGSGVNVGAGTITCNYDGFEKHRTVIEDGVFIGSDTQLVAPVTIGRDAVLGAGSTITKDVAPGALALTRAKQTEIAGYAEKRRGRAGKKAK